MASDTDPRPDGRRAWLVVAAGTLAMTFTFGTPYSYGVFLGPLSSLFDVPRVTLSAVFSAELFLFYAGAGLVGIYTSRFPSRAVLLASAALTAALAPALFVVDSLVGLVVVFGLLGVALGTVFVVLASVVPLWFDVRRGIAAGVLFAGAGVSLQVIPPAWQLAFDRVGVRTGFLLICLASAAAFLLSAVVGRRPPWTDRSVETLTDLRGWLGDLLGSRQFAILFVGFGLAFAWYYVLAAFAIDLFASRGFSRTGASVAFGLVGGVSVLSRLGGGAVADRLGHRRTLLVSLGFALVGSVLLALPGRLALWLAIGAYGIGLGGTAALYIPVLLSVYSPEMDTAIVGVFNVAFGLFALLAPPVGTYLVEATGSFVPAIGLAALTALVAMTGIWLGTR